ncbi:MAG: hypothetical protein H6553_11785 [Chitinophagales bacterium]|nr:hypothetical protein [Chitinophagales bacterium]
MANQKIKIVAIVLMLITSIGFAQETTPYSRFGLGYGVDNNNMASSMMGGLGASYKSVESANYINPASYAHVSLISFDAGLTGNFNRIKTETQKSNNNNLNINYLSLTVPIKKYWTSSVGLLPYSNKNYFISETKAVDTTLSAKVEYEGNGTLYNLYWGNGFKYKGFAVGFNVGYLFGKLKNYAVSYPLLDGALDNTTNATVIRSDLSAGAFVWNAGIMYTQNIKSKKDSNRIFTIDYGFSGNSGYKFSKGTSLNYGVYTLASEALGSRGVNQGIIEYFEEVLDPVAEYSDVYDTIVSNNASKVTVKTPASFNVGVSFSESIRWKVGVDFKYQPWSKYIGYENNASSKLTNSWRFAFGGEVIPNLKKYDKFFSRLKYRAGFNYTKTNININNNQINEFGIDFGVGIPLVKKVPNDEGLLQNIYTYSFNLGLQVGKRGTITDNLVQETFVRLKLGFSLNDKWFVKRKYY